MERIGIAASKMAKGNLWLYNLFVVIISFLFSAFIFLISGSSIVLALIIIGYVVNGILPNDLWDDWHGVIRVCMISLTMIVSIFTLFAVLRNIRLKLRK
jgi:hypothetical protein